MDNIQYISLDINNNKINTNIYTKQYDVGRTVIFTVTENGVEKDLTDMYALIQLKKPDGFFVLDDLPVSDNHITLTTTEQMTVVAGRLPYQLSIYHGDTLISTVTGYMDCEKAVVTNEDIESSTISNIVEEIAQEISQIHDISQYEEVAAQIRADRIAVEDATDEVLDNASQAAQSAAEAIAYAIGDQYNPDENAKSYYENTKELYNKLLQGAKITILANGWNGSNEQTVAVTGVTSDEDHQLCAVFPKSTSTEEYISCGVMRVGQGNGSVTFKCTTTPENDLEAYVITQATNSRGVNYFGTTVPTDDVGVNGNIYLQYNDDGIIRVFGKTKNHWTPFSGDIYNESYMLFDTTAADVSGGIMTIATTYAGGNFINTHTILYAIDPGEWRTDRQPVEYTATQDCAAVYYVASKDNYRSLDVYINASGVVVDGVQAKDPMYIKGVQFLKGGQKIGIKGYNTNWNEFTRNFYLRIYPTMSNTEGEPRNSDARIISLNEGTSSHTTMTVSTEVE